MNTAIPNATTMKHKKRSTLHPQQVQIEHDVSSSTSSSERHQRASAMSEHFSHSFSQHVVVSIPTAHLLTGYWVSRVYDLVQFTTWVNYPPRVPRASLGMRLSWDSEAESQHQIILRKSPLATTYNSDVLFHSWTALHANGFSSHMVPELHINNCTEGPPQTWQLVEAA